MANKELYNILQIGEDEYNINAVHSDAAAKIDHRLTINKVATDGTIPEDNVISFDGSSDKSLNIVPSEGGAFTGPIAVKSLADLEINVSDVTPYAISHVDVFNMIQELTGHPCYHWNWNQEEETGNLIAQPFDENDPLTMQKVSLVTGTFEGYKEFIKTSPVFFLYLCEDTGQIFFGQDSNNYKQLGTNTIKLVYEEDPMTGFTAEDIASYAETIQEHSEKWLAAEDTENGILAQAKEYTNELADGQVSTNTTNIQVVADAVGKITDSKSGILAQAKKYTDDEIKELSDGQVKTNTEAIQNNNKAINENKNLINNNTTAISAINNTKTGILVTAKKYTDDEIKELSDGQVKTNKNNIATNVTNIAANKTAIDAINSTKTGILKQAKNYTDSLIDDIKDGTITAKKAASADSATEATKDGSGNTITSYYQKKILTGTKDPEKDSTAKKAADGTIYIKYS